MAECKGKCNQSYRGICNGQVGCMGMPSSRQSYYKALHALIGLMCLMLFLLTLNHIETENKSDK